MATDEELVEIDRRAFRAAQDDPTARGPHRAGLRAVYNAGLARAAEIAREQAEKHSFQTFVGSAPDASEIAIAMLIETEASVSESPTGTAGTR